MRVVSNTSPISNLAIIGRLDLLKRRYGVVRIPFAVAAELSALSHPPAKATCSRRLPRHSGHAESRPSVGLGHRRPRIQPRLREADLIE